MMRLSDEFRSLTEQLTELYQYRCFLDERISMLEIKLKDLSEMLDFIDNLATSVIIKIEDCEE
jgi:hypothetical protein